MKRIHPILLSITIAAFAIGFVSTAFSDEHPVSIGPAIVSFPELCQTLSCDGRKVTCPIAMRKRAAFVSLKSRTWTQVRAALSAAFDVTVRPVDGEANTWTM